MAKTGSNAGVFATFWQILQVGRFCKTATLLSFAGFARVHPFLLFWQKNPNSIPLCVALISGTEPIVKMVK